MYNIYMTSWTPIHHFSIKLRAFYFSPALVWALCEGYGLLRSQGIPFSTVRCCHCESERDWNWLKDSRFLFPIRISHLNLFIVWSDSQLSKLFIISYLFLVISEHSSIFSQLSGLFMWFHLHWMVFLSHPFAYNLPISLSLKWFS